MLIQTLEFEEKKRFEVPPHEELIIIGRYTLLKNFKIVLKNSITDGAEKVKY